MFLDTLYQKYFANFQHDQVKAKAESHHECREKLCMQLYFIHVILKLESA